MEIDRIKGEQGCFSLIWLVLLLGMYSVLLCVLARHISFLWRKVMKVSDVVLFAVALVCGCVVTYLVN